MTSNQDNHSSSPIDVTNDTQDAMTESEVSQLKAKSVSGALSYTLRSLFLFSFGMVTSLVLGAYLSAEEFGVYGIVTQLVGILQFFSTIGLGPTLIQKKSEPTLTEYRTVFSVQQLLSWLIFFTALVIVLGGFVEQKIGIAGGWVLLALAFSFPLDSLRIIPAIMMERKLDFSKLVIPTMVEQIVYNLVLLYAVVWLDAGVISYAYAVLIRGFVGVIAMYFLQSWSIGLSFDKEVIRAFLKTGLQFQLSDVLARIKDQLFYLMLGIFLPLREFGYITWAKNWSQMPYMLTVQNVIAITFPTYARIQHDKNLLKRAIEKTMYFVCLTIFPLLVGMAVFIIPFTQIVVKYQKWQPAVLTFILFTLSIGWAAISTPLTNTLNATGKIDVTVKLMVMWTVLTWVLTPIFIRFFGFQGVGITAFVISFTSVIPIYFVNKEVPIEVFRHVKVPLLSAGVMALVGVLGLSMWGLSFVHMGVGMVVCAGVYGVSVLLFGSEQLYNEVTSLRKKK